ncbi:CatA-like O-acetyltransferase [Pseudoalteromonas mariniglutinosa]|uniref:CatA-like O-acetyltransferase n=1 Tax=Pseudoalteromonas mariniglutinosa TaxID=206042 RepID=UPI00384DE287
MDQQGSSFTKTKIELTTWPRQQHFRLFNNFTQPYFNICLTLDFGELYRFCKQQHISFFHAYIFLTLEACHDYVPMRHRIIDAEPWLLDTIRASVVELADDDTFRFSYFHRQENIDEFQKHAQHVSREIKQQPLFSDAFSATEGQPDLVHISVLPWLRFSGFTHAISDTNQCGIPKLVFGQFDPHTGTIPLAIDVHHALMDGLHVAKFVDVLQHKVADFCF